MQAESRNLLFFRCIRHQLEANQHWAWPRVALSGSLTKPMGE